MGWLRVNVFYILIISGIKITSFHFERHKIKIGT